MLVVTVQHGSYGAILELDMLSEQDGTVSVERQEDGYKQGIYLAINLGGH